MIKGKHTLPYPEIPNFQILVTFGYPTASRTQKNVKKKQDFMSTRNHQFSLKSDQTSSKFGPEMPPSSGAPAPLLRGRGAFGRRARGPPSCVGPRLAFPPLGRPGPLGGGRVGPWWVRPGSGGAGVSVVGCPWGPGSGSGPPAALPPGVLTQRWGPALPRWLGPFLARLASRSPRAPPGWGY